MSLNQMEGNEDVNNSVQEIYTNCIAVVTDADVHACPDNHEINTNAITDTVDKNFSKSTENHTENISSEKSASSEKQNDTVENGDEYRTLNIVSDTDIAIESIPKDDVILEEVSAEGTWFMLTLALAQKRQAPSEYNAYVEGTSDHDDLISGDEAPEGNEGSRLSEKFDDEVESGSLSHCRVQDMPQKDVPVVIGDEQNDIVNDIHSSVTNEATQQFIEPELPKAMEQNKKENNVDILKSENCTTTPSSSIDECESDTQVIRNTDGNKQIAKSTVEDNEKSSRLTRSLVRKFTTKEIEPVCMAVSKAKPTLSENIKRIQDQLKREVTGEGTKKNDCSNNTNVNELTVWSSEVSKEGVSPLKRAPRMQSRSKSRTRSGRGKPIFHSLALNSKERPYRQWHGLSNCVSSDTRFIIHSKPSTKGRPKGKQNVSKDFRQNHGDRGVIVNRILSSSDEKIDRSNASSNDETINEGSDRDWQDMEEEGSLKKLRKSLGRRMRSSSRSRRVNKSQDGLNSSKIDQCLLSNSKLKNTKSQPHTPTDIPSGLFIGDGLQSLDVQKTCTPVSSDLYAMASTSKASSNECSSSIRSIWSGFPKGSETTDSYTEIAGEVGKSVAERRADLARSGMHDVSALNLSSSDGEGSRRYYSFPEIQDSELDLINQETIQKILAPLGSYGPCEKGTILTLSKDYGAFQYNGSERLSARSRRKKQKGLVRAAKCATGPEKMAVHGLIDASSHPGATSTIGGTAGLICDGRHAVPHTDGTLSRLFHKRGWKSQKDNLPKYIIVQAIQDHLGTLPGQLSFYKGQLIKMRPYISGKRGGESAEPALGYGYYKTGRLRKKKRGLFPLSHVGPVL